MGWMCCLGFSIHWSGCFENTEPQTCTGYLCHRFGKWERAKVASTVIQSNQHFLPTSCAPKEASQRIVQGNPTPVGSASLLESACQQAPHVCCSFATTSSLSIVCFNPGGDRPCVKRGIDRFGSAREPTHRTTQALAVWAPCAIGSDKGRACADP
jgi:hypothetical protein